MINGSIVKMRHILSDQLSIMGFHPQKFGFSTFRVFRIGYFFFKKNEEVKGAVDLTSRIMLRRSFVHWFSIG
jgi:hypothetical protein